MQVSFVTAMFCGQDRVWSQFPSHSTATGQRGARTDKQKSGIQRCFKWGHLEEGDLWNLSFLLSILQAELHS